MFKNSYEGIQWCLDYFKMEDGALNIARFGMFVMFAEMAIATIVQAVS